MMNRGRGHERVLIVMVLFVSYACSPRSKVPVPRFVEDSQMRRRIVGPHLVDRPEVARLVDSIIVGGCHNDDAYRSKEWRFFDTLRGVATSDELISLTDHPHPVVRCYAFDALLDRKSPEVFRILLKHLTDRSEVQTTSADISMSEMVGDYMIFASNVGLMEPADRETSKVSDRVSRAERKIIVHWRKSLDSVLLFDTSIRLMARNYMLENIQPIPSNYNRIREIATAENNEYAAVALARYRRQSDISIIMRLFVYGKPYFAARAVRHFPDSAFFSFLVRCFQQECDDSASMGEPFDELYLALANYPTSQTYHLFEQSLSRCNEYARRDREVYLLVAITKFPNPIFQPLRKKIKLNDSQQFDYTWDLEEFEP